MKINLRVLAFLGKRDSRLRLFGSVAVAIVVVSAFLIAFFPPITTTSVMVQFTFSQVDSDRYPNGSPFSVNDLISVPVVNEVWRMNHLEDIGISLSDFSDMVSVAPMAANEAFLRAKYQAILSRKGLTPAEVAAIDREYKSELDSQTKRAAKLMVSAPAFSRFGTGLREKVLSDIPRVWSAYAIEKLGVLSLPIVSKGFSRSEFEKRGTIYQKLDFVIKAADLLQRSLALQVASPGGSVLRDPVSGLNSSDLTDKLDEVQRFGIRNLDTLLQQSGGVSRVDLAATELRIADLQQQRAALLAKSETLKTALADYSNAKLGRGSTPLADDSRGRDGRAQLNLEGDMLQRLIELGSQTKEAEFRQVLTNRRVEAEVQAQDLAVQISRLERRLAGVRKAGERFDEDLAKGLFSETVGQLEFISDAISRIEEAQTKRFLNAGGGLCQAAGAQSEKWVFLSALRVPFAFGLLVIMLAILLEIGLFFYDKRSITE